MEVTREILWGIPVWYRVVMYSMLIGGSGVFLAGILRHLLLIKKAKKKVDYSINYFAAVKNIIVDWLFQRKHVKGTPLRGLLHVALFFGFLTLWIVTEIVALEEWSPHQVAGQHNFFFGNFYLGVSLLGEIGGILLLLGSGGLVLRRLLRKSRNLTHDWQYYYMHGFLISAVLMGFAIEAIRIYVTKAPDFETWSFVGWWLASLIPAGTSEELLSSTHRGLWFWHMFFTMTFIASLSWTRFYHIFGALFNIALARPEKNASVLKKIDFENMGNAEYFGAKTLGDFTWKQWLDYDACLECGKCTDVCPATAAGKTLSPKNVMVKLKNLMWDEQKITDETKRRSVHEVITTDELMGCTTCGACVEACPVSINHIESIIDMRRYAVLSEGKIPDRAADAVKKVQAQGNPWGMSKADKWNFLKAQDIRFIEDLAENEKVDYLYYVGCAGSYDPQSQNVTNSTLNLLKKAGVNFALLRKESCNGEPVRRLGDEYSFSEIAVGLAAAMNSDKYHSIVTHCPHCLSMLKNEYPQFGLNKTVIHHTELLNELLKAKKLHPKKPIEETMTYHDPCYLGRHNGIIEQPREILNAIPGIKLDEMKMSKEKSFCCGMGGGNMWYETTDGPPNTHIVDVRIEHIKETSAKTLAAACPYCQINFNLGLKNKNVPVPVKDVAQLLEASVE